MNADGGRVRSEDAAPRQAEAAIENVAPFQGPPEYGRRRGAIVERIGSARRWYGADWWFIAIGIIILAVYLFLAVAPGWFTSFHPSQEAGPRLMPPGSSAPNNIIFGGVGEGAWNLEDVVDAQSVGVLAGSASEAEILSGLIDQTGRTPQELRILRMVSASQLRDALYSGLVSAVVIRETDEGAHAEIKTNGDVQLIGRIPSLFGDGRYWLGTDNLGRDVLSRVIWGTRVALLIGFIAPLLSLAVGVPLGILSGYTGGALDRVLSIVMDSIFALPSLIAAIALAAVLGPGFFNLVAALSIVYVPIYFRISRSRVLTVKEHLYVEAANALGASRRRVLARYVFPNSIQSAALFLSISVADAILIGASLSFLGLGLPPEIVEWGRDLARARSLMQQAWWMVAFPGAALTILVLSFTLLGDALVEMYNPKVRGR